MVRINEIEYLGIWKSEGKYWTMLTSYYPDWEETGLREFDPISGVDYKEVIPLDMLTTRHTFEVLNEIRWEGITTDLESMAVTEVVIEWQELLHGMCDDDVDLAVDIANEIDASVLA